MDHEFFARAVVPYRQLYGVEAPVVVPPAASTGRSEPELPSGAPFGLLGSASLLHRETKPVGGSFRFEAPNQMSHVGTDVIDYTDDELCGVRVLAVLPNRRQEYRQISFSPVGERVGIIGEFPVRKASGGLDGLGMPDTSFNVRIPADVPYLMQGIDCEGRSLNTDQTWQHVEAGEKRTCNGCHVHSSAATKLPYESTLAGMHLTPTHLLGGGSVPLLAGGDRTTPVIERVEGWLYQVEFESDIMPIFASRCVSCHGAARAEAGLRLDLPRTAEMHLGGTPDTSTWARLANDSGQRWVPADRRHFSMQGGLAKPNLSKYVRMLNARGSLLYWKAANQRTDGRTDFDQPSGPDAGVVNSGQFDVDFGLDHPSAMTRGELRILSRWVDLGAGWGSAYRQDTIAPTVSFVATTTSNAVTGLLVGTTDVGLGVAPSTLTVCVSQGDAGCRRISAPAAAMAGTVPVALTEALTNELDEVEVAVSDVAGNTTSLRRSVRYLLGLPPPIVSIDAGTQSGGADGGDTGFIGGSDGGDSVPIVGHCGCSSAGANLLIVSLMAMLARARRRSARGRASARGA